MRLAEASSYPYVNHRGFSLLTKAPFRNAESWRKSQTAIPILIHQPKNRELKMDHEAETKTIRLTTEIMRCIAKSLLASAEELERSLWHYSTRTEHSQSSGVCDDDAPSL